MRSKVVALRRVLLCYDVLPGFVRTMFHVYFSYVLLEGYINLYLFLFISY